LAITEHDNVSGETVRRRLAENDLKPWRKDMWCIPQVDGEYVARMEDVAGGPPWARICSCAACKAVKCFSVVARYRCLRARPSSRAND